MKKIFIVFSFLPFTLFSQNWQWTTHDNSPDLDVGNAISTDGSGNCFVASDSALIGKISKYDISGNLIWRKETWKGHARAITSDTSGFLYVYGDSSAFGFIAKYDTSGNQIWKVLGGIAKASGICTDNNGNLYATGYHNIARYDTAGNSIWYLSLTHTIGLGICADESGNIYATGYFSGTETFGTFVLTALGSDDIFIAKYDSSGTCLWANRAGGNRMYTIHQDLGNGIATDGLGNVYVTGQFTDTADFNSVILMSQPLTNDAFVAKYNPLGNLLWIKQISGWSDEEGRAIAVDNQGDVLIGGSYVPTINFGNYVLSGWGNYDGFIAKYDNSGNFLNAISAGGTSWNDYVFGVTVDATGNIFATGTFSDTAYFGNDTLLCGGYVDMFVSKVNLSIGTGTEENNVNNFVSLFPNPVTSNATFLMNRLDGNKTLIIYDQLGKEIWRKETTENQIEFSTESFAGGLYFYRIENKNTFEQGKFIIQ